MQLTRRAYQTEDDYWRIRAFLREVFLLNDRRELCWQVARLDRHVRYGHVQIPPPLMLGQSSLGVTTAEQDSVTKSVMSICQDP